MGDDNLKTLMRSGVFLLALTAILLFTIYRSGKRKIEINRLLLKHQEEMNEVKDKFFSM